MKIDIFRITESEMKIMEAVWQSAKPMTLLGLIQAFPQKGLKASTLHTLAGRLTRKGLLTTIQVSGQNVYLPRLTKTEYRFLVAKLLLARLFDGSTIALVTVLLRDLDLTGDTLAALKSLVASAVLPADEWAAAIAARKEVPGSLYEAVPVGNATPAEATPEEPGEIEALPPAADRERLTIPPCRDWEVSLPKLRSGVFFFPAFRPQGCGIPSAAGG